MPVVSSIYSAGFPTPAAAGGAPVLELADFVSKANALAVLQIALVLDAAVASNLGLIWAATQGTPKGNFNTDLWEGVNESAGTALSNGQVSTDWNVLPTIDVATSPYMKQVPLPAIAGSEVSWTWNELSPLIVQPNQSLLVWNFGAGAVATARATVRWVEGRIASPYRELYSAAQGSGV